MEPHPRRKTLIPEGVYDPTPDLDQWVTAQNFPPQFHFFPVGFAAEDTELVMRPQNADGSGSKTILGKDELAIDSTGVSVPVRRIGTLMQERGHDHIDLLKMDIEGAEYAVIDDIVDSKLNIKQLMIEFHVYVTDGVARKRKALDRLKSAGFKITAISRSGCEYSFVKE